MRRLTVSHSGGLSATHSEVIRDCGLTLHSRPVWRHSHPSMFEVKRKFPMSSSSPPANIDSHLQDDRGRTGCLGSWFGGSCPPSPIDRTQRRSQRRLVVPPNCSPPPRRKDQAHEFHPLMTPSFPSSFLPYELWF